ncbi:hypothetical protein DFH08DRAFT_827685 [Mycena albidolilacea]|uniref:Uncharacterized protein n=1 Tax=Mycena albidolilacea TaxID=1033008 RepID=A0AAD6YY86_9AGAR|nr:hypothetical protein DFH08DRAFT_827685 [Mycena albidolilacea]
MDEMHLPPSGGSDRQRRSGHITGDPSLPLRLCLGICRLTPLESKAEIMDAALGVPRPPNHVQIIKQCYPGEEIQVTVTGLQCVGFNTELYNSLRSLPDDLRKIEKRKAGPDDLQRGKTKSQKKI